MDEIKAKQQVVEKIKTSAKILVTVSDSPSVDALSAALGLALLLDKQEKYATAIFSGETPPAIAFLQPEKTFDDTTDSLRDFIIALNKEKADHLRYKVEGDAVKIFITPYKTTISDKDLEFSQGDYNVELVIALGVDNQEHLDKALENHGQILHDAAIITMTTGDQTSNLGGTDWHDSNSSSLSEMVAGLAEALKDDKKKSLLDETIATALLTGIVAETDRFSNEHTTSKSMTVAANLMAAGADQQLIANELQAAQKIEITTPDDEGELAASDEPTADVEVDQTSADGSMTIKNHDPSALEISHEGETLADLDRRVRGEEKANEKIEEEVDAAVEAAEDAAEKVAVDNPLVETPVTEPVIEAVRSEAPAGIADIASRSDDADEPVLGGTLNATTDQAADDARREAENDQNKTILEHSYLGSTDQQAPGTTPVSETPTAPEDLHSAYAPAEPVTAPDLATEPEQPSVAIGGERVIQPLGDIAAPAFEPVPAPETLSAAYAPVEDPMLQTPAAPQTPTDLGLPLPPPLPDFSQLNGAAPAPAIPLPPTQQPEILGDILAPDPAAPPLGGPAVPPLNPAEPIVPTGIYQAPQDTLPSTQDIAQSQNSQSDPGQFQIPPQ